MKWLTAPLDVLYPPRCPICMQPHDTCQAEPLCPRCAGQWPWPAEAWCQRCGAALATAASARCRPCLMRPAAYTRLYIASRYTGTTPDLIHAIKFRHRPHLCRYLARRAVERWRAQLIPGDYDALVPVPLNRLRYARRGFNQAALLAEALAKDLGRPCLSRALMRRHSTRPQSRRLRAARWAHAAAAFRVRHRAQIPRSVLLVDDILATGATAEFCAQALRAAGAARVDVAVIAASHRP